MVPRGEDVRQMGKQGKGIKRYNLPVKKSSYRDEHYSVGEMVNTLVIMFWDDR